MEKAANLQETSIIFASNYRFDPVVIRRVLAIGGQEYAIRPETMRMR